MAQKANSFEKFWKELKRRKVVHLITVYAAVAFVILQIVDMVAEPLRLPDWTKALVIVLLCIGFIIAIFLSWIYDITPAGVKKTKTVSAIKPTDQTTHAVSSGWKIATYISAVIILALVAFNFISKWRLNADITKLEKSIAVLPFINDSPNADEENAAFINGLMDEIIINLQTIKDLRVLGRTSVEQYRNNMTKSNTEIAKELGVTYIVEGSGQKYGNTFRLRVQLIKAKGKETHIWAKPYEQEIQAVTDIFRIHSQIAQAIASELEAVISPEEKQLIEKTPTSSLSAHDFYVKGREEHTHFWIDNNDTTALGEAEDYYRKAMEFDSTFAAAYTGLARVYWDRHLVKNYLLKNFQDSTIILCKIALLYDDQISEAYTLNGLNYSDIGKSEQAIEEFDKAIRFNPNDWMAYRGKARLYARNDFVSNIKYLQKAISINRGPELPDLLEEIGSVYLADAGFPEKAKQYYQDKLKLDGDSAAYYNLFSMG